MILHFFLGESALNIHLVTASFLRGVLFSPPLLELGDEFRQVRAELCKVKLGGLVKVDMRVGVWGQG